MDPYVVCYCPRCAQREFGQSELGYREQYPLVPEASVFAPSSLACSGGLHTAR